ncbi:MAG TPA: IniB N-terminal domain-containing protein [Pseudonocardiaceae bacterium]|nr:IniB N-terminal domain-containing protein [Pseudonocardiaceae bacterium]
MEQADQTLHDFVLNLLSDSQALAAFDQDPAAMLDHAGLSDISAADVQEVIPLVIDYVPAHAEALDAVLSELPVDSVDTGQLGAIQQLQFVTQALGGMPAFDVTGTMGNSDLGGLVHLAGNDPNGLLGSVGLASPLGAGGGSVATNLEHGLVASVWDDSAIGHGATELSVPGLNQVPSAFSAMGDMNDLLDGQSLTNSAGSMSTAASTLMSGATDLTSSALANPAAVAGVLSDPTAALTGLTGQLDSWAGTVTQAMPAPAGDMAGVAEHTLTTNVDSVVGGVASNVQAGSVGAVAGHLPVGDLGSIGNLGDLGSAASDPTHALSSVQGVVDQVTGGVTSHLPGAGDLSSVTGAVSDPTHAVQSTVSTVQGAVSDTVGSVASHSAVSDITSTTGAGNVVGSTEHDGAAGALDHVTSDLHLPSLF